MPSIVKKVKLVACLAGLMYTLPVMAQQSDDYPSLVYEKSSNFGLLFHTRGLGVSYQLSLRKEEGKNKLFDFSLCSVRNPKEIRQSNTMQVSSRPFVYGKINSLIALDAGYGRRRVLADRITRQSIRINLNYSLGPCLGILKPVYYDIQEDNPDGTTGQKVSKPFNEKDPRMADKIIGNSPFMTGIGKTHFMPGAVGKFSLNFEWGNYDDKYFSIETGVMVNAFPWDVPIFAFDENQKVFTNLFLIISYGTRK